MTDMTPIAARRRALAADAELRRSLHRFVEGRLRNPAESEDLVQETYLRLYDYRSTRSVADIGAFCFAVARNLIHDHLRRRSTTPPRAELAEEIACPQPRAEEILDYRQRVTVLLHALRGMPPLRREVFTRQRLDGDSVASIAADLELSRAAVEKHVTRAVADLRRALERRGLGMEGRR